MDTKEAYNPGPEEAIAIAKKWVSDHPDKAKEAHDKLVALLRERPHDVSELGSIRMQFGIPKPVLAWVSLYDNEIVQVAPPSNPKRKLVIIADKRDDSAYWAKLLKLNHLLRIKLSDTEARSAADEFNCSELGKRCLEWLNEELYENGPINWSVFGLGQFLPKGVPVGIWLSTIDFVHSVPIGGGQDYCESRKCAPDRRDVRTSTDILPKWLMNNSAQSDMSSSENSTSAPNSEGLNPIDPIYASLTSPFFAGKLRIRQSIFGTQKTYSVVDAVSSEGESIQDIDIDSAKVKMISFADNEYVVGRYAFGGSPFIFFNNHRSSAPVQVIQWNSFNESGATYSAIEFFKHNHDGILTANLTFLIGNKENVGHVIIKDGQTFLKGFRSKGMGNVEYLNVRKYNGDFMLFAKEQQPFEFNYQNQDISLLIPPKQQRYSHPILDCDGWIPLEPTGGTGGGGESGAETSGGVGAGAETSGGVGAGAETNGGVGAGAETNGGVDANPEEAEFLRKLIRVASVCGYEYDPRDLVRFHTSVKTGGFTVLGGAPGCGKSSLVALYARALLGKKTPEEGDGYLMIDVSPSWMEPEDILGHWGLKDSYVVSQTGLVPFLRKAVSEEGFATTPIVCLEEMNLARVEHYFADFMQQLCRDENERELKGVPKDPDQKDPSQAKLPLTPLVRFVGTNNFDETTQRFSQRFYDRCNYIELSSARISEPFSGGVPSFSRADFGVCVDCQTYASWFKKEPAPAILEKAVVEKYKSLMPVLLDMNLPASRRTEVAILVYVANRPFLVECGDDPSDRVACQMKALDEVIAQKILSRYTGNPYSGETESEKRLEHALDGLPLSLKLFQRRSVGKERPGSV